MRKSRIAAIVLLCACAGGVRVVKFRSSDGAVRYDSDGDGYAGLWECPPESPSCNATELNKQPIADLDCNDREASIHPGAKDVPGDGIDQNCDGGDGIAKQPVDTRDLRLPGQAAAKSSLTVD